MISLSPICKELTYHSPARDFLECRISVLQEENRKLRKKIKELKRPTKYQ